MLLMMTVKAIIFMKNNNHKNRLYYIYYARFSRKLETVNYYLHICIPTFSIYLALTDNRMKIY